MNDAQPDHVADGPDFAAFDTLVEGLTRWVPSQQDWPPARRVAAEWGSIAPRLDRARRELSRVLVVGVIGGTGTGKSTLVNALAGAEVTEAGDIARPTTVSPVVVTASDIDLSWLPVDEMHARIVRSESPAVANIVLVDCPDPDTQADDLADPTDPRPSASNRNRDLLEKVLPACDVLLLVATAQKYRSWIVAREVAAYAPGRPLLFVQTHASRDPDIRGDWRRELESQGFVVPRIFRLDAVDAAARAAAGLEPEAGFRELLVAIDGELVGRAVRRVRRTGALDLARWFTRQAREQVASFVEPIAALDQGVVNERQRLEAVLARGVSSKLIAGRAAWQRLIADEVLDRWHGGPFATFLHVVAAISSLWQRMRPTGGLVGRLLAGQSPGTVTGRGGWQSVEELGLPSAEVEQSRSVLGGLATRAAVGAPLVGRSKLPPASLPATINDVVGRTSAWLATGIDRLVVSRRGRLGSRAVHLTFEALFSLLVVFVLARAGSTFFYGNLWAGQPGSGTGFLQEAIIWVILWGLVLRWIVMALVRAGLDGDIRTLVARLPEAGLVDPFLADFANAADAIGQYLDEGDRLAAQAESLAKTANESSGLGRFVVPRPG